MLQFISVVGVALVDVVVILAMFAFRFRTCSDCVTFTLSLLARIRLMLVVEVFSAGEAFCTDDVLVIGVIFSADVLRCLVDIVDGRGIFSGSTGTFIRRMLVALFPGRVVLVV